MHVIADEHQCIINWTLGRRVTLTEFLTTLSMEELGKENHFRVSDTLLLGLVTRQDIGIKFNKVSLINME